MNKDQTILEKCFSHNSIYSDPQSSLSSQSQSWPSFAITVLILLNWFYKTLFVIYILTLNNNYFFIYLSCQLIIVFFSLTTNETDLDMLF